MENFTYDCGFRIPGPKFYEYYISLNINHLSHNGSWAVPRINLLFNEYINGRNVMNVVIGKKCRQICPKICILAIALFATQKFKYLYITIVCFYTISHVYAKVNFIITNEV